MRINLASAIACLVLVSACQTAPVTRSGEPPRAASMGLSPSGQPFKPFPVLTDRPPRRSHYVASGYMGDSDLAVSGAFIPTPTAKGPCLRITYSARGIKGWAGIFWQDPADNWGDKPGRTGYDLRGARKLTFWARGEHGGERIHEFKMGGLFGIYPDSDVALISSVRLTKEWTKYTIDLTGKDLQHIIGGFCFTVLRAENPAGMRFYLDDVFYEGLDSPAAVSAPSVPQIGKAVAPVGASVPVPAVDTSTAAAVSISSAAAPAPKPAEPEQSAATKDLKMKRTDNGLKVSFSSQFLFAPGQAALQPGSSRILDQLSSLLAAYPSNHVLVEGHTDATGSASFNLRLSQLRAEAVKDYLVKQAGYDASRFKVVGYGATRPIGDNALKSGRSLNRRVEVTILKNAAHE